MVKLGSQLLKLGLEIAKIAISLSKCLIFCTSCLFSIGVFKSRRQHVKHLVGGCKQSSVVFTQLGFQLGQGIAAHPALHLRLLKNLHRYHFLISSHFIVHLQ